MDDRACGIIKWHLPGAMPLTLIPRGNSLCARDEVACPMADFEKMYGNEQLAILGSYG